MEPNQEVNRSTDVDVKHEKFSLPAAVFRTINTYLERFGWPGTALIFICFFVVWYATPEQKAEIIDLYVLGKGISNVWPLIGMSILFVLACAAQHHWYKKQLKVLENENRRIGREKSEIQQKLVQIELQHVRPNRPT